MAQPRIERMSNESRVTNHGKLAVLTIAAAAVAAILVLASMTSVELTAGDRVQMPQADTAPTLQTGGSSSYFPGQYVNQATESNDHIQAY